MECVFEPDEVLRIVIDPNWSAEELLDQEGMISLKDAARILKFDTGAAKRLSKKYQKLGENLYEETGLRKVLGHWIIRMSKFGPYYRRAFSVEYREVNPEWNGNDLLAEAGIFLLSDVCRLLPFGGHQIRYQAKRLTDSHKEIGVFTGPNGRYFIDMLPFRAWIERVWRADTENESSPSHPLYHQG